MVEEGPKGIMRPAEGDTKRSAERARHNTLTHRRTMDKWGAIRTCLFAASLAHFAAGSFARVARGNYAPTRAAFATAPRLGAMSDFILEKAGGRACAPPGLRRAAMASQAGYTQRIIIGLWSTVRKGRNSIEQAHPAPHASTHAPVQCEGA